MSILTIEEKLESSPKITLIYIIGRGHSGSTLLDLLLGNHSDVIGLGELKWISNEKRADMDFLENKCTCGAPAVSKCHFWQSVDDRLQEEFGLTLASIDVEAACDKTFVLHNLSLLYAVQSISRKTYLVDSSKTAHRLFRLKSLCSSIDIRPVYIFRDAYGTTYSHIKRGRSVRKWAKKYARSTDRILQVLADQPFHLVEYRKLSSAPFETLRAIMNYLDLEPQSEQLTLRTRLHHNIGGNNMRFNNSIRIAPDEEWRKELTSMQKFIIFLYTNPQQSAVARLIRERV